MFPLRRSRGSVVSIATRLQAGRVKVCIPVVERDIPFSNTSRPAPGHTQPPIEYCVFFPGVKAAGAWIWSLTSYTRPSPVFLNGMGSYRYLSLTYSNHRWPSVQQRCNVTTNPTCRKCVTSVWFWVLRYPIWSRSDQFNYMFPIPRVVIFQFVNSPWYKGCLHCALRTIALDE